MLGIWSGVQWVILRILMIIRLNRLIHRQNLISKAKHYALWHMMKNGAYVMTISYWKQQRKWGTLFLVLLLLFDEVEFRLDVNVVENFTHCLYIFSYCWLFLLILVFIAKEQEKCKKVLLKLMRVLWKLPILSQPVNISFVLFQSKSVSLFILLFLSSFSLQP